MNYDEYFVQRIETAHYVVRRRDPFGKVCPVRGPRYFRRSSADAVVKLLNEAYDVGLRFPPPVWTGDK